MKWYSSNGFTFVELILVVTIIGVLISIAITANHVIITKTKIITSKNNLYALRRALEIYKAENDDKYPQTLTELTVKRHIERIPYVEIPNHIITNRVIEENSDYDTNLDEGCWWYNPSKGELRISCNHKDTEGKYIHSW